MPLTRFDMSPERADKLDMLAAEHAVGSITCGSDWGDFLEWVETSEESFTDEEIQYMQGLYDGVVDILEQGAWEEFIVSLVKYHQ